MLLLAVLVAAAPWASWALRAPVSAAGSQGRRRVRAFAAAPPADVSGTALEALAKVTTLSIDSGDLGVIAQWSAMGLISDATTNPLFVAQAGSDPRYVALVDRAIAYAKREEPAAGEAQTSLAMDRLAVELGLEIVKLVPGYVSTEVDIRESFDTAESVRRARRIIAMYEAEGVGRDRILVKLAGTWEGIKAAEILEAEGITCNITLVFGFAQAVAAAQANARLISPFPGRIKDWHSANGGAPTYEPPEDPGVVCVRRMYRYYKRHGHGRTICMPASWRPSRGTSDPAFAVDEVLALQGVDRMTMPPALLEQLAAMPPQPTVLHADADAAACEDDAWPLDEPAFRFAMNRDMAATTKLAEGINAFVAETLKLQTAIQAKL